MLVVPLSAGYAPHRFAVLSLSVRCYAICVCLGQATLAELRGMLQLVEADTRQVYISVVNPLLSARLAGMMEHGDFTAQVGGGGVFRSFS